MKKPGKLFAKDLKHPKGQKKSTWNGDVIRDKSSFNTRVHTVEGTRKPSNVKPVRTRLVGDPPPGRAAGIQPIPSDHQFSPVTANRPSFDGAKVKQLNDQHNRDRGLL